MSYVAISPAGALALRALTRHGYRPVLATGRSIGEVRERCEAYRLAGGVAEYGAVAYDHLRGQTVVLLHEEERETLGRLRGALAEMEGVYIDDAFAYAVRAYRLDASGKHRGLDDEAVARALARIANADAADAKVGNAVTPIGGVRQTDFMVRRVNKESGLRELARLLGADAGAATDEAGGALLALAVGDTVHDLPMLALAERAYAPCNADGELRKAFSADPARTHIVKGFFGAGLLEAVASFLGHDPRRCGQCRPPRGSQSAEMVLTTLAALDEPAAGKLRLGVVLAARLARLSLHTHHSTHATED
jgi:hydroxymethylpyrimidine pyrophosphatase-like HAD family hydrolase